jgi:hypothetical protein
VVDSEAVTAQPSQGPVTLSSALSVQTRRSMVFAKHLRAVGDEFRSQHLNSTDAADKMAPEEDWTKMKVAALLLPEKELGTGLLP